VRLCVAQMPRITNIRLGHGVPSLYVRAPARAGVFLMSIHATAEKPKSVDWRTPAVVVVCGCLIAMISFGPRSSLGFFCGCALFNDAAGLLAVCLCADIELSYFVFPDCESSPRCATDLVFYRCMRMSPLAPPAGGAFFYARCATGAASGFRHRNQRERVGV